MKNSKKRKWSINSLSLYKMINTISGHLMYNLLNINIMELTISIKERTKLEFLIQLLKEFEYVEIIDIKEDEILLPIEHQELLRKD